MGFLLRAIHWFFSYLFWFAVCISLQGGVGFWFDCVDFWQVSHCDLSMASDGIQRICSCVSSLSVLGLQPATHSTSLSV